MKIRCEFIAHTAVNFYTVQLFHMFTKLLITEQIVILKNITRSRSTVKGFENIGMFHYNLKM